MTTRRPDILKPFFPDDLLERVRRVLEPGEQGWPEQTEEL